MFLVLLCVENDFKRFGIAKVFSELLADLKSLETDGIDVDGEPVKGCLYCIAGDNLGSHCIGGFTENFSCSQYFCNMLIRMPVVLHALQKHMTRLLLISSLTLSKTSEE